MAVYRESPPIWRRYLPLIVGIGIVIAALLILLALNQLSASVKAPPDKVTGALDMIAQSIDLFDIHFPYITQGTPVAGSGAEGAINRAQAAFTGAEADLRAVNADAASALSGDLAKLKAALNNPTTNIANTIADANAQIVLLRKGSATPAR